MSNDLPVLCFAPGGMKFQVLATTTEQTTNDNQNRFQTMFIDLLTPASRSTTRGGINLVLISRNGTKRNHELDFAGRNPQPQSLSWVGREEHNGFTIYRVVRFVQRLPTRDGGRVFLDKRILYLYKSSFKQNHRTPQTANASKSLLARYSTNRTAKAESCTGQ